MEKRQASLMSQKFEKREQARQNKADAAARSKAFHDRKELLKAQKEMRAYRKELMDQYPHEYVATLEADLKVAKAFMYQTRKELEMVEGIADSSEEVAKAFLNAQEARRSYHSLRVSLIYRKKKLAQEFKPNPDEAAQRELLWATVK